MPVLIRSRFEELPGEVRNMVFSYTLLAPGRKIDIAKIEHKMPASQFFPERKRIFREFECVPTTIKDDVCFPLLRVNKFIGAEAIRYLYGCNQFSLHATAFEASYRDPEYPSGTLEFLSKLSPMAHDAIRNVQLSVSQWFLNSIRWHPMCTYFASEMHLARLHIIVMCVMVGARHHRAVVTKQQLDQSSMSALSQLTHPWMHSVVVIQGLEYFSLHTDHCGQAKFGDLDKCLPEIPKNADLNPTANQKPLWWMWEAPYTCFPRGTRNFIRERLGLVVPNTGGHMIK